MKFWMKVKQGFFEPAEKPPQPEVKIRWLFPGSYRGNEDEKLEARLDSNVCTITRID